MSSYCIVSLYVASMPGNIFYNGILFGLSETFTQFFAKFILDRLHDVHAYYLCYVIGLVSYAIFIFSPGVGIHTYMANVLAICSIASIFNIQLLILEMRVPPLNVGSVSLLQRTLAVGCAVISPQVAVFPQPWPYISLVIISTCGFLAVLCLPPPGLHLPQVENTGENTVKVVDRQTE